jgi:uncharacterized Tic20 family protein
MTNREYHQNQRELRDLQRQQSALLGKVFEKIGNIFGIESSAQKKERIYQEWLAAQEEKKRQEKLAFERFYLIIKIVSVIIIVTILTIVIFLIKRTGFFNSFGNTISIVLSSTGNFLVNIGSIIKSFILKLPDYFRYIIDYFNKWRK